MKFRFYQKHFGALLTTLALLCLLITSCAHVEAPSGGAEDKIPPQISGVFPAPQSLNNSSDVNIYFQFTEWVSEGIPRNAIRISPPLEHGLTRTVNRDYLEIKSRSKLDSNTTYTLSLSNELQDLRGNGLREPFTLSFSTGDTLDTLTISGFISSKIKSAEVKTTPIIALYPIGKRRLHLRHLQFYKTDSTTIPLEPDLTKEKPYYIASPDTSGAFLLTGLKAGMYKVMAFNDENGNSLPDSDFEPIALNESDVKIDTLNKDIFLSLDWLDTNGLQLDRIDLVGENRISTNFNKPAHDSLLLEKSNYELWYNDSLIGNPILVYKDYRTKNPILQFNQLFNNKEYTLKCYNLQDSLNHPLDTARSYSNFVWSKQSADSLKPVSINHTIPNNGYKFLRPNDSLFIIFNRQYDFKNWEKRSLLLFREDTIEHTIVPIDPITMAIIPNKEFPLDANISLKISYPDTTIERRKDSLGQIAYNNDSTIIIDTIINLNYKTHISTYTISPLKKASLKGKVLKANNLTKGKLHSIYEKKNINISFDKNGSFSVDDLIEGSYFFEYFQDINNNNRRDKGQLNPFEYAEPYRKIQDTLYIKRNENLLNDLIDYVPPLF